MTGFAEGLLYNRLMQEIVEALKNDCNIIPVLENFDWPDADKLPDDMRAVCRFNGIR